MHVRPLAAAVLIAVGTSTLTALPTATTAAAHTGPHTRPDSGSHTSPHSGADPAGAHDRADSRGTVAEVRKAIAPFRDVAAATAAGYVPVSGCEQSPEGGMGIHYLNPALAAPGPVDPARPAILLYGPDRDGGLRLLGAEYWQPAVGQPTPTLAGQPFEGPMPGHGADMPEHFDLHVWTEVANPSGVFAPWNPRVHC